VFRKTCNVVTWVLRVAWGFVVFFRGNNFFLQYVDASLWTFLEYRAAFRFQVGQLVAQEVECSLQPQNKYWWLSRRLLFILVQLRTLLLHHSYTMLPKYTVQFTVEKGPLERLQFIQKHDLGNPVPIIVIILRIFLTIAVGVVTY